LKITDAVTPSSN